MKIATLTLLLTFLCGNSWALLPAPPVIKDENPQINQYFKELYDNHNIITVIKSSPNGVRNGASGEVVIVSSGGTYKFWVNQGGKVWLQI